MPTNQLDQAIMFELEHIVISALRAAIPMMADEVFYKVGVISGEQFTHLNRLLDSRSRYFIQLTPKQRRNTLPRLMDTFSSSYEFLSQTEFGSRANMIPPDVFVYDYADWPNFKW